MSKEIDLRPDEDQDEAEFATTYYKDAWMFDQYQDDRIIIKRKNCRCP